MTQREYSAKRDAADAELTALLLSIPADVDADFTMNDAREVLDFVFVGARDEQPDYSMTRLLLATFRAIWAPYAPIDWRVIILARWIRCGCDWPWETR